MEKVQELGPSVAGGAVTRSERLGNRGCQRPGKGRGLEAGGPLSGGAEQLRGSERSQLTWGLRVNLGYVGHEKSE